PRSAVRGACPSVPVLGGEERQDWSLQPGIGWKQRGAESPSVVGFQVQSRIRIIRPGNLHTQGPILANAGRPYALPLLQRRDFTEAACLQVKLNQPIRAVHQQRSSREIP